MADENGWVRVGTDEPDYHNQCWFTDGYFDFVPHFLEGMADIPDMASQTTDHMLRTSSIIQRIEYSPKYIKYRTFDSRAKDLLRVTFSPTSIKNNGEILSKIDDPSLSIGWNYDPDQNLLQVSHTTPEIEVFGF